MVDTFEEFKESWPDLTCKLCLHHVEAAFEAGIEEQLSWKVGDSPSTGMHLLTTGPSTGALIAVCDVTKLVHGWDDFVSLTLAGDGAVSH